MAPECNARSDILGWFTDCTYAPTCSYRNPYSGGLFAKTVGTTNPSGMAGVTDGGAYGAELWAGLVDWN